MFVLVIAGQKVREMKTAITTVNSIMFSSKYRATLQNTRVVTDFKARNPFLATIL